MSQIESSNELIEMREIIGKALREYKAVKEKCEIADNWHKASIENKARPFLLDYFTLAVIGRMNSDKSTFINALVGDNLLPTDQTIGAITYIEDSESNELVITFCDEHKETFKGINIIKNKLLNLVSIPEEYSGLPINDINSLISCDQDISKILKQKKAIEERTMLPPADDELWKKYVTEYPKKRIAHEVHLFVPLKNEFKGWRIINTPTIGARGDIQDEIKGLISRGDENKNKVVDAIIFLQDGTDIIEDLSTENYLKETFAQLTPDAKNRLFFILTKSSQDEFRNHKDDILSKLYTLFGKPYNISKDRITFVDSLLHKFCNDVEAHKIDIQCIHDYDPLPGWAEADWNSMANLLTTAELEIKEDQNAITNETIISKYREWSHLREVQQLINNFVVEEKRDVYNSFESLIQKDYNGWFYFLINTIRMLEKGLNDIIEEKSQLDENRIQYNDILKKLKQDTPIGQLLKKFDFIDEEINKFNSDTSIPRVQTRCYTMKDKVEYEEKEIFTSFKTNFETYCNEYNSEDIILRSIDFEDLERIAGYAATESGFCAPFTPKTTNPHTTDEGIKLREFKDAVIKEFRERKNLFFEQFEQNINSLYSIIYSKIDEKIHNEIERLNNLQSEINKDQKSLERYMKYQRYIDYKHIIEPRKRGSTKWLQILTEI